MQISNHPVHMFDKNGKVSPSAFIPFCDFGGNASSLGKMMEPYDIPVCNSFQPIVRNDQLCYEVDLDKYKGKDNIDEVLKSGLVFFMDYNEDRQITLDEIAPTTKHARFVDKVEKSKYNKNAFIFLNTIGIC